MASKTTVTITHNLETTADLKHLYQAAAFERARQSNLLQQLLSQLEGGARMGSMDVTMDDGDAVAASGTITLSGVGAANDTILINGVTFTAQASGATGNQWNVGASATASAAAIAAAITASATALVSGHVTATSSLGVVTITSKIRGVYGNAVTIAKGVDAGSVMTVSGARLTAGAASANSTTVTCAYGV
jgi:phage tail sheath gpL-like